MLTKKIVLTLSLVLTGLTFSSCSMFFPLLQTFPATDEGRAEYLLQIHYDIAARIPVKKEDANFLILSDFHTGYGWKDRFKHNAKKYENLLKYFFFAENETVLNGNNFKLVLIGDVYEGWGFQESNIPLIRKYQAVNNEYARLEEILMKNGRYIGIYGNHDDFLRGNPLRVKSEEGTFGKTIALAPDAPLSQLTRIVEKKEVEKNIDFHPAVIIETGDGKGNSEEIFITHGCQGHALHDAGDELAAFGVFTKYNSINDCTMEIEDESDAVIANYFHIFDTHKNASACRADEMSEKYSKQEKNINKIVSESDKFKHIKHLILGHTHHAYFFSKPVKYEQYEIFKKLKEKSKFKRIQIEKVSNFPKHYFSNKDNFLENNNNFPASVLGDQNLPFNYHNTGMACNFELPFLVIYGGEFYFFYLNGSDECKRILDDGSTAGRTIPLKELLKNIRESKP